MKPKLLRTASITAVGGFVPEYRLTNQELEKLVDTSDEWIRTRTGIEERRILKEEGKASSDLAIAAINEIIRKRKLDPNEIDCIICGTMTPDMPFTVTGAYIAWKIGATNAWAYDLTAACCGFLFGLTTAASYIESGRFNKIIVVGVDKMSPFIDYTDRGTCILFGDGAGAVLVEPGEDGLGVLDSIFRSNGFGRQLMHMKAGGSLKPPTHDTINAREHYAYMDGKAVYKYAVTGMAEVCEQIIQRNNLSIDEIAWIVPHQANLRIIEAAAEHINLPYEKLMLNLQHYGNTIAGTIPLCLWDYESKLKKGDNIILVSFGGGFTWGATWLKWAYDGSGSGLAIENGFGH
jgi:3-oxoacyl-[acyl-carrier-protein] synthase III